MKTTLLSLWLSAAALTTFTTSVSAQKSGDEAAIRQLVHDCRLALNKRDLKTFADYFVQLPSLYYQVLTPDNHMLMARGWEAMTHMVGGHMKNDPQDFPADPTPTPMTDTHIQIRENTAWLDGTTYWESGGKKWYSRDLAILEKQADNGSAPRWKVAALTTQTYSEGKLVVIK